MKKKKKRKNTQWKLLLKSDEMCGGISARRKKNESGIQVTKGEATATEQGYTVC